MKKTLLLFAMGAMLSLSANAQWFDFSNNKGRLGIGFHLGEPGLNCDYSDFGAGVSLDVMGIYLDYIQAGPDHKYDNHVTNTLYNDSVAWGLNIGYQIPVLSWLRVMPLLGYFQTNAGLTDATTVNINTDENSSSWYHDYNVTSGTRQHYFNFGVGLVVQPLKWFSLYGVYTTRSAYGGVCIYLSAFAKNQE